VALAVAFAFTLVLGGAIGAFLARRFTARRLTGILHRLDADPLVGSDSSLPATLERLEKAVAKEQALAVSARASIERLRLALDALPAGVVVTDGRGTVVLRNRSATHFLGIRHADVLVDEAVGSLLRVALAGEHRRQTLELYGPPKRTVVITAVPVEDAVGVAAALATIEDVTERSRLESVRTDFVANISHELKTPVGALALLAEALVGEDEPDIVNRLAEKMVIEAHRVARIIEDLLELSRIELGESPHREVVSVGLIAAEAVERVRHLAEHREIRIEVHEPSRRVNAVGDRRELVSAVANLVENGVKYSDPGSVVEVTARTDGTWVDIDVRDHGIGIPPRDLDRIFERFYRVDRARSRETGGTGLGLAIVRHVATNHGGNVSVTSREGAGSTFTLRIPAGPGPVAVTTASSIEEAG
jgi:two-component system, OmpR family, sensor histidine kinase SenX3